MIGDAARQRDGAGTGFGTQHGVHDGAVRGRRAPRVGGDGARSVEGIAVGEAKRIADDVDAPTRSGIHLRRVVWASVQAVDAPILLGVERIGNAATTNARRDLGAVVRAAVVAVERTVEVGVGVGDAAAADAGGGAR